MALIQRIAEGLQIEVVTAQGESIRVFVLANEPGRKRLALGVEAPGSKIRINRYGVAPKPAQPPPEARPSPLVTRRPGPPIQRRKGAAT